MYWSYGVFALVKWNSQRFNLPSSAPRYFGYIRDLAGSRGTLLLPIFAGSRL
jgi:hypothetical protein